MTLLLIFAGIVMLSNGEEGALRGAICLGLCFGLLRLFTASSGFIVTEIGKLGRCCLLRSSTVHPGNGVNLYRCTSGSPEETVLHADDIEALKQRGELPTNWVETY